MKIYNKFMNEIKRNNENIAKKGEELVGQTNMESGAN